MDGEVEKGVEEGVREVVGLQAKLQEFGALGVVVVLLGLSGTGKATRDVTSGMHNTHLVHCNEYAKFDCFICP